MSDLMKRKQTDLTTQKSKRDAGSDIDAFLQRTRAMATATAVQRGRLIFALDATASRQPTWDAACEIQAEMFHEVSGLNVQLVYFRGHDECRASGWISSGDRLANIMKRITCKTGGTQIGKVLAHTRREIEKGKVQALVFVGDSTEEQPDELVVAANELGTPAFMFQEGNNATAEQAFREIARLTHGAYCRFDAGSAQQLAELLRAVAAYAAGGVKALAGRPGATKLLEQLRR